jgi:hypothetical protein
LESTTPVSPPLSFDSQIKNASVVSLRNPLDPDALRQSAGLAREADRRASLFRLAAGFAAAAAVATVAVLFYLLMGPGSRQSDTASTSPPTSTEVTGAREVVESPKVALPVSDQDDIASKPALAQFRGLLATPPASQPSPQEQSQQSQQLLQQFMQWRQKDNSSEAPH